MHGNHVTVKTDEHLKHSFEILNGTYNGANKHTQIQIVHTEGLCTLFIAYFSRCPDDYQTLQQSG